MLYKENTDAAAAYIARCSIEFKPTFVITLSLDNK